jgi:hypothetical protein
MRYSHYSITKWDTKGDELHSHLALVFSWMSQPGTYVRASCAGLRRPVCSASTWTHRESIQGGRTRADGGGEAAAKDSAPLLRAFQQIQTLYLYQCKPGIATYVSPDALTKYRNRHRGDPLTGWPILLRQPPRQGKPPSGRFRPAYLRYSPSRSSTSNTSNLINPSTATFYSGCEE